MIRPMIGLLALGVVLAASAGCGTDAAAEGEDAAAPPVAATRSAGISSQEEPPVGTSEPVAAASLHQPAANGQRADTGDRPPTEEERSAPTDGRSRPAPAPEPTSEGELEIAIAIAPDCVRPGSTVTVTIDTEPASGLSMGIGFADGAPHGAMNIGTADSAGRYVWRAAVSPDVPPGTATVIVAGGSEDGERSGWARNSFLVAGLEGCP